MEFLIRDVYIGTLYMSLFWFRHTAILWFLFTFSILFTHMYHFNVDVHTYSKLKVSTDIFTFNLMLHFQTILVKNAPIQHSLQTKSTSPTPTPPSSSSVLRGARPTCWTVPRVRYGERARRSACLRSLAQTCHPRSRGTRMKTRGDLNVYILP